MGFEDFPPVSHVAVTSPLHVTVGFLDFPPVSEKATPAPTPTPNADPEPSTHSILKKKEGYLTVT